MLLHLIVGGAAAASIGAVEESSGEQDLDSPIEELLSSAATVQENETNESTPPPHRNPDEVRDEGDIEQIEAALAGWLGTQIADSTMEISEGEYERGRELVGEEYDDVLGQFVEVSGETGNEETADSFEKAKEDTEEFANETEEFEETHEEYQQAREEGDEGRARELARELQRQAEAVNQTGGDLNGTLGELGARTGTDYSDQQAAIQDVITEKQGQADEIAREAFVETDLTVRTNRTDASFLDPVEVTGRLETVEGEPIAEERVTFHIGERTYTTETDEAGEFRVVYRPVRFSITAETLTVEFLPEPASEYRTSSEAVPLQVAQVTPHLSIESAPTEVAYDDVVSVDGTVTAGSGETPVPNVPVVLELDGDRIASGSTDDQGRYLLEGRVPATVEAHPANLTVRVDQTERAIGQTSEAASVDVQSTDTTLSLDATAEESNVVIRGALETASGVGIGSQTVTVLVNETAVGEIETGQNGRYSESISIPDRFSEADEVTLKVVFDGSGTNLEDAAATTVVTPSTADAGGSPESGLSALLAATTEYVVAIGVAIAAVLVGLSAYLWRAGYLSSDGLAGVPGWIPFLGSAETATPEPAADSRSADAVEGAASESTVSQADRLLDHARTRLEKHENDEAVQAAYGAVRRRLGQNGTASESATHWEFYLDSQDRLDEASQKALELVTEAYERAEYARDPIDETNADEAIDAAAALFEISN